MKIPLQFSGYLLRSTLILLMFYGVGLAGVSGQEQYRTTAGTLIITASLNGKPVKISSKNLLILLDYETGNVMMKQKISNLFSKNDTLISRLRSGTNESFRFEGKLGIDYINTQGHPPLDFPVEGTLYPQGYHLIGSGHLVHRVQRTTSTCLLSMNFQVEKEKLFKNNLVPGMSNEIHVQIVQSLLSRIGD